MSGSSAQLLLDLRSVEKPGRVPARSESWHGLSPSISVSRCRWQRGTGASVYPGSCQGPRRGRDSIVLASASSN